MRGSLVGSPEATDEFTGNNGREVMSKFKSALIALWKEEEGLTTDEYAIAGGLVGAAVILAFTDLGQAVGGVIEYITSELTTNTPAAP